MIPNKEVVENAINEYQKISDEIDAMQVEYNRRYQAALAPVRDRVLEVAEFIYSNRIIPPLGLWYYVHPGDVDFPDMVVTYASDCFYLYDPNDDDALLGCIPAELIYSNDWMSDALADTESRKLAEQQRELVRLKTACDELHAKITAKVNK